MISDAEVIRRAIANGWKLEPLTLNSIGYMTGMWRRDGVGRPYGTFPGPRWEMIAGKRVKTSDGPHTVSAADVFRDALDHDDHCGELRWDHPDDPRCEDGECEMSEQLIHAHRDDRKLLAEFFDIDMDVIEQEKRVMLDALRGLE